MKCALEMAIAIEEAKRLEAIKAEEERKRKYEEDLKKFYEKIESINSYVEKELLKSKGEVELLCEECFWRSGFYYFGEKDYDYKNRNGGYPHYYLIQNTPIFPLDIYIEYLKSHCYTVKIENATFKGASSTGKTTRLVPCIKMIISI